MKDFCFRLNPHTFVRHYAEFFYMENQVSHTRAMLPVENFMWLATVEYKSVYSFEQLYKQKETAQYIEISKIEGLLHQLHDYWLIDIIDLPITLERKFSYAQKHQIDNLFVNAPLIGNVKTGKNSYLRNLQIELTDRCNERCIHCYLPNEKKDKGKTLTVEQIMYILHQYREMQGLKVVFSGGEILLHTDLFRILEECRRLNLMILLQSNLLSLTEDNLQKIKALNVFNVQVSLYSTDKHIHDMITGRKGSFEKTKRNLELLVANDIPVMISCPVMQHNFPSVRSLHKYASELGVDVYFDFMMMAECNGSKDNLAVRLDLNQTREMLQFHLESHPAFLDAIATARSLEEALSKKYARRRTMCDILSASLCIDSDGSIYPCPGWNGMKLGHISTSILADVWLSEKANELRSIHIGRFQKCNECNLHNFCDMCAVYNYNENGDIYNICPRFCNMADMLRECVINKYNEYH